MKPNNCSGIRFRIGLREPAFWIDHLHPEDRPLVKSYCATALTNWIPQRFEHRMMAADGREVWLRTSVLPVKGDGRNELVGVMTDITDRKRAQEHCRSRQPQ